MLLQRYHLEGDESEIRKMSEVDGVEDENEWWRNMCVQLNEETTKRKETKSSHKISNLCKEYLKKISPNNARLLFRIRSQMVDLCEGSTSLSMKITHAGYVELNAKT